MTEPNDPQAALARELERLAREMARVTREQADHDAALRSLADAIALLARPTGGPPMQSWLWPTGDPQPSPGQPSPGQPNPGQPNPGQAGPGQAGPGGPAHLDPDQAIAMLDDLCTWLGRVYLRYEDAVLPTCWAWHPDVVEELLWLRGAHADAYAGRQASWQRVGDWHDRQRPGVVKRIRLGAGRCDLGEHREGQRSPAPPMVPLHGHAALVAATWAYRGEVPVPTAAVLDDALRHEQAAAQKRR